MILVPLPMSLKIYAPLLTFATKHGRYLRKMDKRRIGTLSFVRASSEPVIVVIYQAQGSRFELRHLRQMRILPRQHFSDISADGTRSPTSDATVPDT